MVFLTKSTDKSFLAKNRFSNIFAKHLYQLHLVDSPRFNQFQAALRSERQLDGLTGIKHFRTVVLISLDIC